MSHLHQANSQRPAVWSVMPTTIHFPHLPSSFLHTFTFKSMQHMKRREPPSLPHRKCNSTTITIRGPLHPLDFYFGGSLPRSLLPVNLLMAILAGGAHQFLPWRWAGQIGLCWAEGDTLPCPTLGRHDYLGRRLAPNMAPWAGTHQFTYNYLTSLPPCQRM